MNSVEQLRRPCPLDISSNIKKGGANIIYIFGVQKTVHIKGFRNDLSNSSWRSCIFYFARRSDHGSGFTGWVR
jgi:hypothetical protein